MTEGEETVGVFIECSRELWDEIKDGITGLEIQSDDVRVRVERVDNAGFVHYRGKDRAVVSVGLVRVSE